MIGQKSPLMLRYVAYGLIKFCVTTTLESQGLFHMAVVSSLPNQEQLRRGIQRKENLSTIVVPPVGICQKANLFAPLSVELISRKHGPLTRSFGTQRCVLCKLAYQNKTKA